MSSIKITGKQITRKTLLKSIRGKKIVCMELVRDFQDVNLGSQLGAIAIGERLIVHLEETRVSKRRKKRKRR